MCILIQNKYNYWNKQSTNVRKNAVKLSRLKLHEWWWLVLSSAWYKFHCIFFSASQKARSKICKQAKSKRLHNMVYQCHCILIKKKNSEAQHASRYQNSPILLRISFRRPHASFSWSLSRITCKKRLHL